MTTKQHTNIQSDSHSEMVVKKSKKESKMKSSENPTKKIIEEIEEWLAIRKKAGGEIDPETAEVDWDYRYTVDPYGTDPELPEEFRQVGREYFARSPGSTIWVWFGDLPDATSDALWGKHKAILAFPAGLPF